MRKSAKSESQNPGDLLQRILGKDKTDKRIVILRSLWRLMLDKGYASTSLTDIAMKAGLSPSHLAYYFPSKEAIVVELFDAITDALSAITTHGDETPIEQCHMLASHAFLEPTLSSSDRSMVLELSGIAVHNPRLRRRHQEYTRKTVKYLTELYARTPRAFGLSPEDAAFLAMSLWMGLVTTSYFYKGFSQSRARALFRQHLLLLAGFADQNANPVTQASEHKPSRHNLDTDNLVVVPRGRRK